jgi:hypothetical protein
MGCCFRRRAYAALHEWVRRLVSANADRHPLGPGMGPDNKRRGPFLHPVARHPLLPAIRAGSPAPVMARRVWGLRFRDRDIPRRRPRPGPSINCRRRFRTVDRINKRQVYRGYRVTEVVNSFPEHSNSPIPHKAYHDCAVRMTKILYWKHTTQDWQAQS